MRIRSKNVLETLIRVRAFKPELAVPTNARAEALFTQVDGVITSLETHGTDQLSGAGATSSGVDQKQELAAILRGKLRDISRTARGLDPEVYPGVRAQFRMPRSQTYQTLLAASRAFLEDIGAVKAGFVESGMPVDFDEKLAELVSDFATATQKRDGGLSEQISGTAGLDVEAREGVRILGMLDSVLQNLLKANPPLLAAWDHARHIPRLPQRAKDDTGSSTSPSSPPQSGGSTTASVSSSAPAAPATAAP